MKNGGAARAAPLSERKVIAFQERLCAGVLTGASRLSRQG